MRKNIWAYLDEVRTYILTKTSIFSEVVVWKPMDEVNGLCLFFSMVNNNKQITNDIKGTERKKALFDFYIIWENKNTAEVEIYEAYDSLANSILTDCSQNIDIWNITIHAIQEWNQSGILRDVKGRPFLIAQITISYTYQY